PEVAFSTSAPDARSDVYSLAATLWTLLTGRSPFEDGGGDRTPITLMRKINTLPPPSTGRGEVPPSLDRLLQMGMAKKPENRPSSAIDFARALQAIQRDEHLPETPITVAGENAPRREAAAPGEDDTRVRAPKRINPARAGSERGVSRGDDRPCRRSRRARHFRSDRPAGAVAGRGHRSTPQAGGHAARSGGRDG